MIVIDGVATLEKVLKDFAVRAVNSLSEDDGKLL